MSGNKCSYINCRNSNKNTTNLRKCFFPVKDLERCQKWILFSGNASLALLNHNDLKKKFLCGDHFPEEMLRSAKLPPNALPFNHQDTVMSPRPSTSRTYSVASCSTEKRSPVKRRLFASETSTPKKQKLEVRFITPTKTDNPPVTTVSSPSGKFINELASLPSPSKENFRSTLQTKEFYRKTVDLPFLPKVITNMQLSHKPKTAWSDEEKRAALCIFFKSPTTYRFLLSNGFILPSTSTLGIYIRNFKLKPGFNKKVFENLKQKAGTMEDKDKKCILLFDEMDIKENVEFCKKTGRILGFEDLGEFGCRPVPAKRVLVLMLRGIYSEWKLPLCYYFSSTGAKAEELQNIVSTNLEQLKRCDLKVVGIVCDQSTTNQKCFRLLNVSADRPYFYHESEKYYAIFDVPHLLKSVRNNLLQNDFIINSLDLDFISWRYIKDIYALDRSSGSARALVKLTNKHIYPNNFQKMSVRLASQIFSNSVSAAMLTAIECNQLPVQALPTANFIRLINNLFDALNCKYPYSSKPCNLPLCDENLQVVSALKEGTELFKKLKKCTGDGSEVKYSVVPCFTGMLQSINAILMLHADYKTKELPYILTGRLNQDPLENLFSTFRQRGGYNRNPTCRTFSGLFKSHIVSNLMKPPENTNCEPDEDWDIFNKDPVPYTSQEDKRDSDDSQSLSTSVSEESTNSENQATGLEDCSVVYFAGYLAKKLIEKYNCQLCKDNYLGVKDLKKRDQLLLLHKNYDLEKELGLKAPTPCLKRLTKYAMGIINKNWQKHGSKNVMLLFRKHFFGYIRKNMAHLLQNEQCYEHITFLINLLITVTLHKKCKYFNASPKKTVVQQARSKLSIMKHN